jgi:FHA domain-containing protein
MSYHLEIWRSSGPELITLTGQRVTVGKLPTCVVSLDQDATVSRMHALLENFGFAWSIRDL